jgi:VIT1/CCC1 family predicted Fe2+/Mn2+ transporter
MEKQGEKTATNRSSLYIRNVIFGVEDSLVSMVGLLSGIALGNVPRGTILLTGVIYIFVEAFSMAVGSFLSEESVEQFENSQKDALPVGMAPAAGGSIMFVSSVVAGFIPLLPYLWFSGTTGLTVSIIVSLVALGILGYVSALAIKTKPLRRAFRMLVLGGSAIIIGALVSMFVRAA